jgi:phage gpG-like protein
MPSLPRGKGKFGIRNYLPTPVGPGGPTPSTSGPLRLSDIKYSVYGGLRFQRVLTAGWEFTPSIGIVAKDIDRLGLEITQYQVPLHAAAAYMSDSIKKNFRQQGRPSKWEPLAEYTVKLRGNRGPILIRTGNLMRAATSLSIWSFTATTASVQSLPANVWYGNIHQEGYGTIMNVARKMLGHVASELDVTALATKLFREPRPPAQQTKFAIPQREFILFQEPEDVEAIQEIFINWMEGLAGQVGRSWNRL